MGWFYYHLTKLSVIELIYELHKNIKLEIVKIDGE